MDEQTAAADVDTDAVAYWRDRAQRAERACAAERERTEFILAAVVGAADGRVRYA